MNQKEELQDQLDILATNLEIINQKLTTSPSTSNGKVVEVPQNSGQLLNEILKIQQWISTLVDHLMKLESNSSSQEKQLSIIKDQADLIKKDTSLNTSLNTQVKSLLELIKQIASATTLLPTLDKKLSSLNLLDSINTSLNEIKTSINSLATVGTRLQNLQDSLENQKTLLNTNQSQIIYVQKLQNHQFQELSKKIQQLPYRPVNGEESQKMLQFPEDEQLTYLQAIRKEISLSKKNSPLMFTLLIVSILMFSLVTIFMVLFFLTS